MMCRGWKVSALQQSGKLRMHLPFSTSSPAMAPRWLTFMRLWLHNLAKLAPTICVQNLATSEREVQL
eukprot:3186255-Amphidinium_carterae.1